MSGGAQLPRDFDIEVGRDAVKGYTPVSRIGNNPEVGSTFETLWDVGGFYVFPTAGETLELVSDDPDDTILGTGARKVEVRGLDVNYVEQTEIVELSGTTPKATVRTDWFRPEQHTVVASGSSQTNEGTITIRVSGGGTKRAEILPGTGTTFNGFITVPAGKTFFLQRVHVFIPKNEDVTLRNRSINPGTNTFVNGADVSVYQNNAIVEFKSPPTFTEKTDLEVLTKSTNTEVSVTIVIEGKFTDGVLDSPPPIRF